MNLVQVTQESITIGQPLPFALRDETGILLARKGFIIVARHDLEAMRGRGLGFYVDVSESARHQKAFVGKLFELVRDERPIGKIASAQLTTKDLSTNRADAADGTPDWLDLQIEGNRLLREVHVAHFPDDLEHLHRQLSQHSHRNADGALFALFHLAASELDLYSATHAMLVSVICGLTAREVLQWPGKMVETVCKAALTMNVGMSGLQDRLALQQEAPSATQRQQIEQHPEQSAGLLMKLGLHDPDWLEAVRDHHRTRAGELGTRTAGQRMARLIQRADMFAARLSPRASRRPSTAAAAMQACYFDENREIDEAGAALIKAVGVYSPGSLVRLANLEVGVVVRRGANTTTPRVAILLNRNGFSTGEHVIRDTSQRELRITSSVAQHECKVKINLDRLLALTTNAASGRLW
jgi:HD-GYP domain-containing protein (c-di-GMP phosphodiesterase class II)